MASRYRHTQTGWVMVVTTVIAVVIAVPILLEAESLVGWAALAVLIVFLVGGFGAMTIIVDEEAIEARLGAGVIRKRVPLSTVRSYRRVTTPWYYGWGIRLIPGGTLYNVSGTGAVELVLDSGKRLRFGTDEPEALYSAIEGVKGPPQELRAAEEQGFARRARRHTVVAVAVLALIAAGTGALIVLEMRPPRALVSGDTFKVDSTIYGAEIAVSDVISVTLEDRLPPVRLRTNGFALGRTLRGHFRLDELGDGRLFIEAGVPPYVLVRTREEYLIVNFADSVATRELFARLSEATSSRSAR